MKNRPITAALPENDPAPIHKALSQDVHTRILLLASALTLIFLVHNHGFVSMWVEGAPELSQSLLILLGFLEGSPACWVHIGSHPLPLALSSYIGPVFIYAYAPTAWIWFSGFVADPYIYRLTGIAFLVADAWILFFAARRYFQPALALGAALLFLTTPNLLLAALTEGQSLFIILFFPLLASLFIAKYRDSESVWHLFLAGFFAGTILLTRVEVFVWLLVPIAIHCFITRKDGLGTRWTRPRSVIATAGLVLGTLPILAFNLTCANDNLLQFMTLRVLPTSVTGPTARLGDNLLNRLETLWSYNVLHLWPNWVLDVPNIPFGIAACIAASLATTAVIRERRLNPFLLIILTTVPLSLLVKAYLRVEHFSVLQPIVLMLVISEVARLRTVRHRTILLTVLIVSNVVVTAMDWRHWNTIPKTTSTFVNASDPPLLARYLESHHRNDRIVALVIGTPSMLRWASAGRIESELLIAPTYEGLEQRVSETLADHSRTRVFVTESRQGFEGNLATLYRVLDREGVRYERLRLSTPRRTGMYDIAVVKAGQRSPR